MFVECYIWKWLLVVYFNALYFQWIDKYYHVLKLLQLQGIINTIKYINTKLKYKKKFFYWQKSDFLSNII